MHQATLLFALSSSIALVTATPRPLLSVGAMQVDGVATFNNFINQATTVCNNKKVPDNKKYFGAAIGDISLNINGGQCTDSKLGDQSKANYDKTKCSGQSSSAPGPRCDTPFKNTCGLCFKVENYGNVDSPSQHVIGSAIVQVIDACPAGSAMNYCKVEVPANQRCGDPNTNSLDIDQMAYKQLTGTEYSKSTHPNLKIKITASNAENCRSPA